MDHGLNPRFFQIGEALVGEVDAVFDLVKIISKKLLAKVVAGSVNRPRAAGLFVKADAEAAAFLAQITFACGVHHVRVLDAIGHHIVDQGHLVSDDILVLHRVQREIDASHGPDFARPEAACIDHMFGMDRAFVGDHIPCAIRALVGLFDHGVRLDRGAAHARGFGIGVGCA